MEMSPNVFFLNRTKLEMAFKPFMNDDDADAIIRLVVKMHLSKSDVERAKIIADVNELVLKRE